MSTEMAITRFSTMQRVQHVSVMTLFILLSVTGFPQKFFDAAWAGSLVNALGGIGTTRFIHRLCGWIFTGLTVAHLGSALGMLAARRVKLMTIVPTKKDFHDAMITLRYYLGLSKEQARFDRFDYRQKFEYWGLVMGALVMTLTGLMLLFPTLVASALPGQLIPAAKVMHSNEGMMAFLVVIIWHLYNAHFNPDVFPFDTTIFTGKISRERMVHEHPMELERLEGKPVEHAPEPRPSSSVSPTPNLDGTGGSA